MPREKCVIRICTRCKKQIDYTEKTMVYICDIVPVEPHEWGKYRLKVERTINLCKDCSKEFEAVMETFCDKVVKK